MASGYQPYVSPSAIDEILIGVAKLRESSGRSSNHYLTVQETRPLTLFKPGPLLCTSRHFQTIPRASANMSTRIETHSRSFQSSHSLINFECSQLFSTHKPRQGMPMASDYQPYGSGTEIAPRTRFLVALRPLLWRITDSTTTAPDTSRNRRSHLRERPRHSRVHCSLRTRTCTCNPQLIQPEKLRQTNTTTRTPAIKSCGIALRSRPSAEARLAI